MVEGHPRPLIIHYHIFKNAGTTVDSVLARQFGESFVQLESPDNQSLLTADDLLQFIELHPGIRAISTHTLAPPKPHLPGWFFADCILIRHPLDRLNSMYEFYRRTNIDTDPLSSVAKRNDAAEFFGFLMKKYPQLVNNGQVNYLNGGRRLCREPDLKRALTVARNATLLGVTERFDEFMVIAEQTLSAHFGALDFSYRPQNVTPNRCPDLSSRLQVVRKRCGEQLYERLLKLNRLDLQLLEAVTDEAHQRFQQVPCYGQAMTHFLERCKSDRSSSFQR